MNTRDVNVSVEVHPEVQHGLLHTVINAGWISEGGQQAQVTDLYDRGQGEYRLTVDEDLRRHVYYRHAYAEAHGGRYSVEMDAWYLEGERHIEVVLGFGNDSSQPPRTGDLEGQFGFFFQVPEGAVVVPRFANAHGITPYGNGGWKLPIRNLARGQRRYTAFMISYGSYQYSEAALYNGTSLTDKPRNPETEPLDYPLLRPDPVQLSAEYSRLNTRYNGHMLNFQSDPWPDYRQDRTPGSSGDQYRLGCCPADLIEPIWRSSSTTLDLARLELMMVEPSRPTWWRNLPHTLHNAPDSAYLFGQQGTGLHRTSRWKAGQSWSNWVWDPPMGNRNGWGGWNLEHLVSALPVYAWYSRDPWAERLCGELGWIAANVLCTHPISANGYYGIGYGSQREFARPLRTIWQCSRAGDDPSLRERVRLLVSNALRGWAPLGYGHTPTRPDEQVDGNKPINDTWQLGLLGWIRSYIAETGDRNALSMLQDWGNRYVQAWRGAEPGTLRMAKQALVSNPAQGRGYGHGLEHWSYGFAKSLVGVNGIDQADLGSRIQALEQMHPRLTTGLDKWSCADWASLSGV